jgi:hypothetical protein
MMVGPQTQFNHGFDVLPGTRDPKMNNSFVRMVRASFYHACAQDGCLKHPHLTIIDRDMRLDSGWFLGGLGVARHLTHN